MEQLITDISFRYSTLLFF